MPTPKPQTFIFPDDGKVPNNPALPVLVYDGALDLSASADPAAAIERLFKANGWGRDTWRNGVYPFVHYHSMIHEALGIARGHAKVQLGGHQGRSFDLKAGDIVVLPAGTGHQRLLGSDDFLVVGGYRPRAPTISAVATIQRNVIRPCRRSRACRGLRAIPCSARTAA